MRIAIVAVAVVAVVAVVALVSGCATTQVLVEAKQPDVVVTTPNGVACKAPCSIDMAVGKAPQTVDVVGTDGVHSTVSIGRTGLEDAGGTCAWWASTAAIAGGIGAGLLGCAGLTLLVPPVAVACAWPLSVTAATFLGIVPCVPFYAGIAHKPPDSVVVDLIGQTVTATPPAPCTIEAPVHHHDDDVKPPGPVQEPQVASAVPY